MKAKFGAIVVAGSGKIGGHVASRNKSGAYFRTKVTPVNPNTSSQATVRARLALRSQAWKGLTAAQRDAWNAAVADFAKTNIFGDLVNPSGFNLYNALNNNLVNIGEAAITAPPAPASIANMTSLSVAVVTGVDAVTITFAPAIAVTEKVILFATPPLSPGKSFVKSEYRQIDVLTSADVSPKVVTTEYLAKFGDIGATGRKIFVKCVPVSVASGQQGIGVTASCISTA